MTLALPITSAPPLEASQFDSLRLDTIFDCNKWDAQFGDVPILSPFPLILSAESWRTLATTAEQLAAELMAAEQELLAMPKLIKRLGLPQSITRLWQKSAGSPTERRDVRLIRFDFHYTTEGWRISEANADTPSGFIEASCFTAKMAQHYPGAKPTGDPTDMLAQAIREAAGEDALVGLIHATAYSDDRQVVAFIGQYLERYGLRTILISPAQIRWSRGHATLNTEWQIGKVDFVVRFFPAEWLPGLPRSTGWPHYFDAWSPPACNPTSALLVQSKRFPLVWDSLKTPLPTWREMLPETREPRSIKLDEAWVVKPALGRAGETIGMADVTPSGQFRQLWQQAERTPNEWILQRRFETVPVLAGTEQWYPCIGVYTINGRAAGVYGRIATSPLIGGNARDVAVLVANANQESGEITDEN